MNNQLSIAKADPHSTLSLNKSLRPPNSAANLHLRTDSHSHFDPSRQQEGSPPQLRETLRRPRMPYNKLPDAFNLRQKKKSNKDIIEHINRVVKIHGYRGALDLLEPIPKEPRLEKPREPLLTNPFATIHDLFKKGTRFAEASEQIRSPLKLKAFSLKQVGFRQAECLTLQILKHRHNTGTLKKILHVPSLEVLTSKEEPLVSKQQRIALKAWLQNWQHTANRLPQCLQLQSFQFNVPEGAISIFGEYCQHGSLKNLLDSVFTLPESVIQEVFSQVLSALQAWYGTPSPFGHFGGLSPSQVLLTGEGKVKLGLGLFYHLSSGSHPSSSLYNLRWQPKKNPFDMNATQKSFLRINQNQETQATDRAFDVFKLGLMMLEAAIGGLENFEQSPLIEEAIKGLFTEEGQNLLERENICCLIHSESFLLEVVGQSEERSRRDRLQSGKAMPYSKFLKERFSVPFQNYLCCCLKLKHSERLQLRDLQSHSFMRHQSYKDSPTVHVSLQDLLLINIDWSQELIQSVHDDQGDRLVTHILHILSKCPREAVSALLSNHHGKILSIGQLIGVSIPGIGQRLHQAILELTRLPRDGNTSI